MMEHGLKVEIWLPREIPPELCPLYSFFIKLIMDTFPFPKEIYDENTECCRHIIILSREKGR